MSNEKLMMGASKLSLIQLCTVLSEQKNMMFCACGCRCADGCQFMCSRFGGDYEGTATRNANSENIRQSSW